MRGLIVLAMFAVSFVHIKDSSDSVEIHSAGESAAVDDGSIAFDIQDGDSDLSIESDGGTRLSFNDIQGNVESDT